MKKSFMLLAVMILLFASGCGDKKLTCTREDTSDGYTTKETMNISYKDDIITKIEQTILTEMDEETIDYILEYTDEIVSKTENISGIEIEYSKENSTTLKGYIMIDYSKLDEDSLKENLGDDFDVDDFLEAKNQNIDEFKEQNLDGYTCN